MKITMYELLGMLKDGKAPKKIKYNGKIYNYEDIDYFASDYGYLFDRYNASGILNDEVEIIEEEKKTLTRMAFVYKVEDEKQNANNARFTEFINEIIDHLNSKGDE